MPRNPSLPTTAALLCGVDEAGRGPLAGAVFAAAVVLDPAKTRINGLADSKLLTAEVREKLAARIRDRAMAWAVASASVTEIDSINILRASLLAMKRAVEALGMDPEEVCVDGLHVPQVSFRCRAIVRGDQLVAAISAASILAKVARDAEMAQMEERYPGYGFAHHKGYATPEHLAALRANGPCEIHRRSFEPVQVLLQHDLPF
ncbi:MAG TPA: ribonuclease HII [Usitatibacter sp.]|nr:ribonuclease HII [Usitatibacter sp.]